MRNGSHTTLRAPIWLAQGAEPKASALLAQVTGSPAERRDVDRWKDSSTGDENNCKTERKQKRGNKSNCLLMKANKDKSKREEKGNQLQGLLKPGPQGCSGGAGAEEGSGKRGESKPGTCRECQGRSGTQPEL